MILVPAFRAIGTPVEVSDTSVSFSFTLTANDVLYAIIATFGGAQPTGVTWNTSEAMTPIGFQAADAGGGRELSVYRLVGGTATTANIVATQTPSQFLAGVAFSYSNVNLFLPEDGVVTDSEAPADQDLDVSITSPTNDLAVLCAVSAATGLTFTPTNGTERGSPDTSNAGFYLWDRAGQNGATQINGSFSANPAGFTTIGFNLNARVTHHHRMSRGMNRAMSRGNR